VEEPFRQWRLDFIGDINPPSSGQHEWILITTNYFIMWVEAIQDRNVTDLVVIKFIEEKILSLFGFPFKIMRITLRYSNISSSPTSTINTISLLGTPLHTTLKVMVWLSPQTKLW